MTADLVAFLRERLDEDEQTARAAAGCEGETCSWTETRTPEAEREQAHNERWSPARVLAEVDAKRRILDEFGPALAQEERDPADMENQAVLGTLERVAALLALPYADHPDYRAE